MNLEFGCGENPTKEGFKTCDIRNLPGVDYACPAWKITEHVEPNTCLLYTSPSPRDATLSRMPSSA